MAGAAVGLAQELVRIDSSDPGAYEAQIASALHERLAQKIARTNLEGVVLLEEIEALPARPCIVAKIPGQSAGPGLVFVCHMDTVTLGEGWTVAEPLSGDIRDGKLWGRGAADMKSGLASAVIAFEHALDKVAERRWQEGAHETCACSLTPEELAAVGAYQPGAVWLPERSLALVLTADEEDQMRGIEAVLAAGILQQGDWLLDTEPTSSKIRVAHKGRLWLKLVAEGVTAHASTPWEGADAIAAMAEAISALRKSVNALSLHPELGLATVTFGQIEGGYQPYVVPDHCEATVDIRHVPPATSASIVELATAAAAQAMKQVPGTCVTVEVTADRPPVERDPKSSLVAALQEATADVLGTPAELDIFTGYTDTAVAAASGLTTEIASYGPGALEVAHKPNEYVLVADIERAQKVYDALIGALCFA